MIRIPEKATHVWALMVQWGDFQEEIEAIWKKFLSSVASKGNFID